MVEKNSVLRRTSRYVSGGETEVNSRALEWWERAFFTPAASDRLYVVERKFEGRLDLISALFLNDPYLWWVIAQYNNVLDPHAEIIEGIALRIPARETVDVMLNGKLGGVRSTREVPTSILPIV